MSAINKEKYIIIVLYYLICQFIRDAFIAWLHEIFPLEGTFFYKETTRLKIYILYSPSNVEYIDVLLSESMIHHKENKNRIYHKSLAR